MDSILNIPVSCFANYNTSKYPVNVNLLNWLRSEKYRDKVEQIRCLEIKKERDIIKATLPAITPSGTFSYRSEEKLIQHSGLIQFDVDLKGNESIANYAELKKQLCNIPNVAYCGLSVSGTGYWGLIPIAYPEKHKQHFEALVKIFAFFRIKLDKAPANVASLRGYSFDAEAYFNHSAPPLTRYEKPVIVAPRPAAFSANQDIESDQAKIEACISIICERREDVTGTYSDWFIIGCNFAATFGSKGSDYFHQISQFHPEYDTRKTDKQYGKCLKAIRRQQPSIAAFLARCKQAGINYTDKLSEKMQEVEQPLIKPIESPPEPLLTKEFYYYSFQELCQAIGYDKATDKVKMYQELSEKHHSCSSFIIHNCQLLNSYHQAKEAA